MLKFTLKIEEKNDNTVNVNLVKVTDKEKEKATIQEKLVFDVLNQVLKDNFKK